MADQLMRAEFNHETGETDMVPLTLEEIAEHQVRLDADVRERAARAERAATDVKLAEAAAAHPDPLVQELARRAGILQ